MNWWFYILDFAKYRRNWNAEKAKIAPKNYWSSWWHYWQHQFGRSAKWWSDRFQMVVCRAPEYGNHYCDSAFYFIDHIIISLRQIPPKANDDEHQSRSFGTPQKNKFGSIYVFTWHDGRMGGGDILCKLIRKFWKRLFVKPILRLRNWNNLQTELSRFRTCSLIW